MTAAVAERRATPVARPAAAPPVPATVSPGTLLAVIAAGAVGAVSIWWADTPSIHGFGDWLTNAGRITGLLAGYAMVVLVALMARLPPVERGVGADRLARWHAMGGRYSVSLVVAHALLITWGYSITDHLDVVSQTKSFLLSYPDVLMASVAGLLLVGVGAVSARAARRKMRYETWYFLHFYTYLAVALAFSHQFADGAEFMTTLWARVVWGGMYAAVAAAILWWRFTVPVLQAFRHRLRVAKVVPEAPGVVSIYVTGRDLPAFRAKSGQFFRWRFLARGHWWVSAPYSLSASPQAGFLRITVKALGDHSASLAQLAPGTRIVTEGPYGAITSARRHDKVLMLAGGVGITPLRALLQSMPAGRITLLYRAHTEQDVLFRDELEKLAAARDARLVILTGSRAQLGYDPFSAANLRHNIPDLAAHHAYVCGPAGMSDSAIAALRACGVPRRQIHHESFEF